MEETEEKAMENDFEALSLKNKEPKKLRSKEAKKRATMSFTSQKLLEGTESDRGFLADDQFSSDQIQKYVQAMKENVGFEPIDDFIEFIDSNNIYVDKTMFIYELAKIKKFEIFGGPRRWGKSLNLSMAKYFFQPDGDKKERLLNGKYNFAKGSSSRKYQGANKYIHYFIGSEEEKEVQTRYRKLKIAKPISLHCGDFVKQYQGQHPVIYLDMKDVVVDTKKEDEKVIIEEIESKLVDVVSSAYNEHSYLYPWVKEHERFKIHSHLFEEKEEGDQKCQIKNLNTFVKILAKLLHEYYGKKVYGFIDEFDKGVNDYLSKGDIESRIKITYQINNRIWQFIKQGSTKGANHFDKLIVVGILGIEMKTISDPLNNSKRYDLIRGNYAKYFGFTEKEIKTQVISKAFHKNLLANEDEDQLLDKLKQWYNGTVILQKEMFTPSSVMSYLHDMNRAKQESLGPDGVKFKTFWESTTSISTVRNFLRYILKYEKLKIIKLAADLSNNKSVYMDPPNNFRIDSLVEKISNSSPENGVSDIEKLMLYYLYMSGYFTKDNRYKPEENMYRLPSKEVKVGFNQDLEEFWDESVIQDKNEFK